MFNLSDLENSLSSLAAIGKGESTFTVNDITITIRVLHSHEEIEIQKYAYDAVKNGGTESDNAATMEYFDRFRLGTLSYAIVEINDQDFRNVSMIETGEKLPNGKNIQIPKHEALKKVLSKFSRTILIGMFKKYGELVEKTEIEAEKYVQFSVEDFDSELARLESRIVEIRKAKADKLAKDEDFISKQVKAVSNLAKVDLKEEVTTPEESSEAEDFEAEVQRENERLMKQAELKKG